MKHKFPIYGVSIFILILLVGCSTNKRNNVEPSNFESIKIGMSQRKVKEKLGEPQHIIRDEDEIRKLVKKDLKNITELSASNPEKLSIFIDDDLTNLQKQMTNLVNGKKIKLIQYEIKGKGKENLYLIDEMVVLRSFN